MPVLSFGLNPDGRPVVDLYVSACSAEREACLEEGRMAPPAVPVRALIDTGAGRSHVDVGLLSRLAIYPISDDLIYTASGGPPEPRGVCVVDLAIAGDRPGPLAVDLEVFGSPIADALRVEMLLGRDVLADGVMTYDGINRRLILAYNPPPRPGPAG